VRWVGGGRVRMRPEGVAVQPARGGRVAVPAYAGLREAESGRLSRAVARSTPLLQQRYFCSAGREVLESCPCQMRKMDCKIIIAAWLMSDGRSFRGRRSVAGSALRVHVLGDESRKMPAVQLKPPLCNLYRLIRLRSKQTPRFALVFPESARSF
jgi:hypothetical protein